MAILLSGHESQLESSANCNKVVLSQEPVEPKEFLAVRDPEPKVS